LTIQQRLLDVFLKQSNLRTDGGRADIQSFGGFDEAETTGDSLKSAQGIEWNTCHDG
jgi:hypothetical protein